MQPDYSTLFHQSSKDHLKGHSPISGDSKDWPESWKTVYYKNYSRLPKIQLLTKKPSADFFDLISQRESSKDFDEASTHSLISLTEISLLLQYSCGTKGLSKDKGSMRRAQPSGGARYPIEVYPLVLRGGEGLNSGLYHYNVKMHALDTLWNKKFSPEELDALFSYKWVKNASVIFLMTAVFHRTQIKYGERGYRYILIEAGHIGQNLYLISAANGLKCVALGGTNDENLEKLLDIDGMRESIVYAVAVGK